MPMSLSQDLRYAFRGLRRQPTFVATTVLTLAVGLSLVTVAFTVFNAYVLRPFAVRDPSTLHQIVWHAQSAGSSQFRWRDYEELRARGDVFESVVAEHTRYVSAEGRPLGAALVSDNYFDALGPSVALGRPPRSDGCARRQRRSGAQPPRLGLPLRQRSGRRRT
jgi:hypothetical protein